LYLRIYSHPSLRIYSQEAGSRKQEAGSRKQEAGSRKQEAGSRKQEAGSRKQEAGKTIQPPPQYKTAFLTNNRTSARF
jgi:hypothetical protein